MGPEPIVLPLNDPPVPIFLAKFGWKVKGKHYFTAESTKIAEKNKGGGVCKGRGSKKFKIENRELKIHPLRRRHEIEGLGIAGHFYITYSLNHFPFYSS